MHPRHDTGDGTIIIGGTGRAGTTLLVQYFAALGFDTGFSDRQLRNRVDAIAHAGLERPLRRTVERGEKLPYVAKSPKYGTNLHAHLADQTLRIRHCIIPVRDLDHATQSRRDVDARALAAGHPKGVRHPGGVRLDGADRSEQDVLASRFFGLVFTMLRFEVPIHFLLFPDFARGEQDIHAALIDIMEEHGVSKQESDEAFRQVVRPDFITEYPTSDA